MKGMKGMNEMNDKGTDEQFSLASQASPPAPPKSSIRISPLVDDSFLAEMKKIYRPEDVDRAKARMDAWLLTPKGAGKAGSKARFAAFLRDAEPMAAVAVVKRESEPEGWRDIVATSCPDYNCPASWGDVFPTIREGVIDEIKRRNFKKLKEGAAA
jgi:hypothetical protein